LQREARLNSGNCRAAKNVVSTTGCWTNSFRNTVVPVSSTVTLDKVVSAPNIGTEWQKFTGDFGLIVNVAAVDLPPFVVTVTLAVPDVAIKPDGTR
jgi:hypothetical protein